MGPVNRAGGLMDITPLLERWEEEDPELYAQLNDGMFDFARWPPDDPDGLQFGLAMMQLKGFIFYRVDWYEEAGLPHPPRTWDELLENSRILTEGHPERIGFSVIGQRGVNPTFHIKHRMLSFGVPWSDGLPDLSIDATREYVEWHKALVSEGLTSPDVLSWGFDEMRGSFITGEAAHMEGAPGFLANLAEEQEYGEQWLGTAVPSPAAVLPFTWMILATTDYPYEASLVLRYMAEYEQAASVAVRYEEIWNTEVMTSDELLEAKPWAADLFSPEAEEEFDWQPQPAHERDTEVVECLVDMQQAIYLDPAVDTEAVIADTQECVDEFAE
jgi:ABC-type glycerol-3-phosphate transport system substrate-binding protein